MESFLGLSDQASEWVIAFGPRLLYAATVLIAGWWIIKFILRLLRKTLIKSNVEESLRRFLHSLVSVLLKVLLLFTVAEMIGIRTTSFIAIIGAASLAIGFALQGSLANFAGGVLILLFKPFRIGHFIEAQGFSGTVKEIQIFNTILRTPDNKIIYIPNGPLSGGSITNYSAEETRRVDMTFGIGYDDDIRKAKELLQQLIAADARILPDPAPQVVVGELADSSVNFKARAWCKSSDYWGIFFDMQEKVKLEFDRNGISIPFPQQDVHVHNLAIAKN